MILELKQKDVEFELKKCRLFILRDVTDLIKTEYDRNIAKLSEIMIASASHDMRTPLNTIISMHNLLRPRVSDQNLKKWLQIADNSTNLLLFLVNDTLDFFQLRSGKFKPKLEDVFIQDLVEQCFDLVSIQMQQKKLQQMIEINQSIYEMKFKCDKQRISQILVNLLSNALKFTYSGHIKIQVDLVKIYKQQQNSKDVNDILRQQLQQTNNKESCFFELPSQEQTVIQLQNQDTTLEQDLIQKNNLVAQINISVEDTGIGIKDEDLGKLFKMFGKLKQSESINPSGIGLGLTICNHILNAFGSKLEVKSSFGHGSVFYFTIDFPIDNIQQEQQIPLENQLFDENNQQRRNKNFSVGSINVNDTSVNKVPLSFIQKSQGLSKFNRKSLMLLNEAQIVFESTNNIFKRKGRHQNAISNIQSLNNEALVQVTEYVNREEPQGFDIKQKNFFLEESDLAIVFGQDQDEFKQQISEELKLEDINIDQEELIVRNQQCMCTNILIVDDNNFNIFSLQTILEYEFNMKADTAFNGLEATKLYLKKVQREKCCDSCTLNYDLIFMDISMPLMDGYEATNKIREIEMMHSISQKIQKKSYIIGLTAHSTEFYKEKCFQVGMNDFMTKPLEQKELLALFIRLKETQ